MKLNHSKVIVILIRLKILKNNLKMYVNLKKQFKNVCKNYKINEEHKLFYKRIKKQKK